MLINNTSPKLQSRRYLSKGFTLVEIIIVMTVSGVLIGLLFGPLNDLYVSNSNGLKATIASADGHTALQSIRRIVSAGSNFRATNDKVSDPSGTIWTGGNNVLITSNYATWTSGGQRKLLHAGPACEPAVNQYVFFVQAEVLYRRTLTSKGLMTACEGGDWDQKQSCATVTVSTRCQATDAKLLTGVMAFRVDYYTSAASSATSTPNMAKAVLITITQRNGQLTPITTKMRMSQANS